MDKVTVNQLAEDFNLDAKMILSELKKIGVMVFSANQPIDDRFVGKVMAHLKLTTNISHEVEKKAERQKQISKKRVTKPKPKKPEWTPLEGAISKSMTIRKAGKVEDEAALLEPVEEGVEAEQVEAVEPEATVTLKRAAAEPAGADVPIEATAAVIEEPPAGKKKIRKVGRRAAEEPPAPVVEAEKSVEAEPPVEAAPPEAAAAETAKPPAEATADKSGAIVREIRKEKKKERGKVLKRSSSGAPVSEGIPDRTGLFAPAPHRRKFKKKKHTLEEEIEARAAAMPKRQLQKITVPEGLTVKEIAERLDVPARDILKTLFMKGIMVNINQILDTEVVQQVGQEMGFEIQPVSFEEELFEAEFLESDKEQYSTRAPIVTVMGHVDHGKTSLLDAIRQTRVAAGEAGGITQHIGAYKAEINNRSITFIDTPGHEAFTMMRARGAQVTDIVILVVAADDGVMPQTVEAIQHARAAGVPIIVAINKIDKPEANIDRVKRDLSEMGLVPEEWGGSNVFVEVSAKKLINIDQMLEMILLVADMQEIKANPNTKAMGTVIESRLDRARGSVATLLVQNGTLFERDIIVAGSISGKIRAMYDENNRRLDMAGPATPVMVLGLDDLPIAGEKFFATDDVVKARQLSLYRQQKLREELLKKMGTRVSLETLFQRLQEGQIKELPIILKVDMQGSRDAIESLLNKLSTDKVKISILRSAVGAITEHDVLLAAASNAIVVGFNVKPVKSAEELAAREGVDIRIYTVIYTVAEEIRQAMEGLLEFQAREKVIGNVEVRETFRVPSVGTIAGSYVTDGVVRRDALVRLFRDGVRVYEGRLSSLRRFKEDVTEVKTGYECGIGLDRFNDIKVGDELQIYIIEKVKDTLDS
ncbi:MAG TPA: translation initiation factor IF-2 [Acidobacteriota bacterium]|nr:translation initiation factor IF-2 [Acidobacteriota bacterium]HOT00858.1 translation initiation factor IF-2 [Acidobacteriota bacterium]HQF86868.1 translation initiation factor IF-2 [Acidobacteriota bacterium]HQG91334.1 translation initiation factor IF-2 [Acidobacteriota bacterium]